MRIRHIATFAETIRATPLTLAREYLSARDATVHEFLREEDRAAYVDVLLALGRFQHRDAFASALKDLDVTAGALELEPSLHSLMRPVAWSFGDGATFAGYTDDTRWNGFLNIWVTPTTWPYVLAELVAGADGDTDLIEQYRRTAEVDGLVSLTHSLTTSEVTPKWATFFVDYPIATMVPIPQSWTDESWRHETAPSFGPCSGPLGELAQIWIDYEDPARREIPEATRFSFCRRDAIGELTSVYAGDDYEEAVRHVAIEQLACNFAHRLARTLDPTEWQDMRLRNRTAGAGVCASHDFLDANMVMLDAWRATRDDVIVGSGDAMTLASDLDHVNAAWTVATRHYLASDDKGARFDAWRLTGRSVPSLSAEGHDLATIPPSDSAGRVYAVGFIEAAGSAWMVNVANSSRSFDTLIDAEAHLWSVFASAESAHV